MLTWSLKQKDFLVSTAEFYCPSCYALRTYEIKPVSHVNEVHALPLIGTKDLTHVAECQTCKNSFDPDVLTPGNQSLLRLAVDTRRKLLDGTSPGSLKIKLMSDGFKEELVDELIKLAGN